MSNLLNQLNQFTHQFDEFIMGAVGMAHFVAGLFFLKFWTKTRDRFFAMFALAFWVLGINRVVMLLTQDYDEHQYTYWVRFIAYLIILLAILDKNRSK
jgi:hypothetical protein